MKAALGGGIFGDSLMAEMGTGQFEIAAAQLALGGIIFGMKKMVQNTKERHEDRRTKAQRDAQAKADIEEANRQDAIREQQRIEQARIDEQKAQEQKARELQQQQLEQARKYQAEQQAKQLDANNQRIEENKNDMQRNDQMVSNVVSNMDQDRANRLRGRDVNVQGYRDNDVPGIARYLFDPAMLQNDDPRPEEWRYISGSDIVDPAYPDNSSGRFQRTDPPPPNPNPNGPNGGGGNGPNGGNGNFDGQGRPIGGGNNYNFQTRNPYFDVIKALSDQIQKQKNDEKESVQNYVDDQQPLGSNPATWSPVQPNPSQNPVDNNQVPSRGGKGQRDTRPGQNGSGTYQGDQNRPGYNGSGTYNPSGVSNVLPIQQEKTKQAAYDNAHILQNEALDIIANQGEAELTNEEQTQLLYKITQEIPQLQRQQVQFQADDVYSSQIVRF